MCAMLVSEVPRAGEIKRHSFFKGIDWDELYQQEAAFKPKVTHSLDTQNFETFEEMPNDLPSRRRSSGKSSSRARTTSLKVFLFFSSFFFKKRNYYCLLLLLLLAQ